MSDSSPTSEPEPWAGCMVFDERGNAFDAFDYTPEELEYRARVLRKAEAERNDLALVIANGQLADMRKRLDEEREQLEKLRDEVQLFADLFPGDSHDWQYVQNWAKRVRSA